jgi:hypothetical protein
MIHGRDLVLKAFPGADYVQHYSLIIATYLAMTGRSLKPDGDLVSIDWDLQYLAPGNRVWACGPGHAWQRAEAAGRHVVSLLMLHRT